MVASFPLKILKWASNPAVECIRWHTIEGDGQRYLLIRSNKEFCELYGNITARWQRQFRKYEFVKYNPSNERFVKEYAYMYSHPLFSPQMSEEEARGMRCTLRSLDTPLSGVDREFQFNTKLYTEAEQEQDQDQEQKQKQEQDQDQEQKQEQDQDEEQEEDMWSNWEF